MQIGQIQTAMLLWILHYRIINTNALMCMKYINVAVGQGGPT